MTLPGYVPPAGYVDNQSLARAIRDIFTNAGVLIVSPSTDNAVVRFDGTLGALQDSGVIINDSGQLGIGSSPAWGLTVVDTSLTNSEGHLTLVAATAAESVVMSEFRLDMDAVNSGSADSGAIRGHCAQVGATYTGFHSSSVGSQLRALEGHVSRGDGVPFHNTWGMEIGVHTEEDSGWAGGLTYPSTSATGIYISSHHSGWLNTGTRADFGILITGADGWKSFFRCMDTDDATTLFNIGQDGGVYTAGSFTTSVGAADDAALDASGTQITVANGANAAIASHSGLLVLTDTSVTGHSGSYLTGTATPILLASHGLFVAPTTTPAAGKVSVAYDGATGYRIYNNQGASITFGLALIKTRNGI